jgi:hypothetical protein
VFASFCYIQIWTGYAIHPGGGDPGYPFLQRQIVMLELCSLLSRNLNCSTMFTITTTTIILSASAAGAPASLGLDPEYLKFRQWISSSAQLSSTTISSYVKLNNVEVLKSSDGYELWSRNISLIF